MKYILSYEERLGDILKCLPACKFLAAQGHEVLFHCSPQYWSIFDLVSYCRPVWDETGADRTLDLQVNPDRWHDFRKSRLKWNQFVYGLYEEIAPAVNDPVVFDKTVEPGDYGLPESYVLLSPFGYSQARRPSLEWMIEVAKKICGADSNIYALADKPVPECPIPVITVTNLSHLAPLIAWADDFFTINSAPSVVASAVRERYFHVYQPDYSGQDDFEAPNQISLHAPGMSMDRGPGVSPLCGVCETALEFEERGRGPGEYATLRCRACHKAYRMTKLFWKG